MGNSIFHQPLFIREFQPLTTSESARYEDLAKGYFEDFFFPVSHKGGHHLGGHDDMRREMSTPTDVRLVGGLK